METAALMASARRGDTDALGSLLMRHHGTLLRIVRDRMDSRIRGRFDAQDVLQETYMEAAERFSHYVERPCMPFFIWMRFLTLQKLFELHRRHLRAQSRNAAKEVSIGREGPISDSSFPLKMDSRHGPMHSAIRGELSQLAACALKKVSPRDREVLAMRHMRHLTNGEVAKVLGLSESAASTRYARALKRLRFVVEGNLGRAEEQL